MKIDMTNRELFKVIEKAVKGDLKAKFTIILEFQELINKESSKLGKYSEECRDYIEEQIIKKVEQFNIKF